MGIVTVEKEHAFDVHHDKVFKLFAHENHHLVQKTVPHINVEILHGNGGPGTIKKVTFNDPGREFKYIKAVEEGTDKGNMSHCFSIIEGEPWIENLEKITIQMKVEASSNGVSVMKKSTKFIPKPNCTLDQAKINAHTAKVTEMYKVFETQMLANPSVHN